VTTICCLLWNMVHLDSTSSTNISAAVGDSVTLPCKASNNSIRVMWWSRPDQEPKYVLMYRDEQFDPEEQHPSFKNRVDLQDSLMKDGNVSLILKDVKISDAGTYKCRVSMGGTNRRKRSTVETDPISPMKQTNKQKSTPSITEIFC
uniref:Ig-like domain-containing protein n=1 Tax=Amphilophus citrinellus TaxID=61819 RepID=A0A3Q0RL21_AMPCI